jgi:5,10-methylenetetrahydromethanopterin reductase
MPGCGLRFEISVALQTDKTPAEYRALAAVIDDYAFDRVSVYNDLFYQPALGPLLLMAPHLRRARRLGPAALNPFTVHPVEIAGQVALLDLATDGRAYLGLARGAWLERLGLDPPRPIAALREAVGLVRHLLAGAGETTAFEGRVFRLAAGSRLAYAPRRTAVEVTLGTWGRRTARLAGAVADEVKVGGSANPAMAELLRPAIRAGCAAAGRPADAVGLCLGAVTVVDEDRAAARARARRAVAPYLPVVAPLDPTTADREWLARLERLDRGRDYDGIAGLIDDATLDRFAFAGAPADIVGRVEALVAAGVSRVEFGTPHGAADAASGIRLLGGRVLPAFGR